MAPAKPGAKRPGERHVPGTGERSLAVVVRRGDVYENPVTGERAVVIEGPEDNDGARILALVTVSPGGAAPGEHFHSYFRERFHVLSGELGVRLDGRETTGRAGDDVTIAPGVAHDWWNAGDSEANVLVEVTPPGRFGEMITTIFALARAGESDARGRPALLQAALLAGEFDAEIRFSRPPWLLQRALFAILAPIARARGHRAVRDYGEPAKADPRAALERAGGTAALPPGWERPAQEH